MSTFLYKIKSTLGKKWQQSTWHYNETVYFMLEMLQHVTFVLFLTKML